MLRIRAALDPARPVTAHAAVLAGLAVASGLGFRLDQYQTPARRGLQDTLTRLDPGMRELITQTQDAVDSALLAHRAVSPTATHPPGVC
jgi:hypothetical protein